MDRYNSNLLYSKWHMGIAFGCCHVDIPQRATGNHNVTNCPTVQRIEYSTLADISYCRLLHCWIFLTLFRNLCNRRVSHQASISPFMHNIFTQCLYFFLLDAYPNSLQDVKWIAISYLAAGGGFALAALVGYLVCSVIFFLVSYQLSLLTLMQCCLL